MQHFSLADADHLSSTPIARGRPALVQRSAFSVRCFLIARCSLLLADI
jgi:hypothetical protein